MKELFFSQQAKKSLFASVKRIKNQRLTVLCLRQIWKTVILFFSEKLNSSGCHGGNCTCVLLYWISSVLRARACTVAVKSNNYFRFSFGLGPVHTYAAIFESVTLYFRIRLPSTRIRRIRQQIRKKIYPLSREEKNISATNPITCGRGQSGKNKSAPNPMTCGRVNPDIF